MKLKQPKTSEVSNSRVQKKEIRGSKIQIVNINKPVNGLGLRQSIENVVSHELRGVQLYFAQQLIDFDIEMVRRLETTSFFLAPSKNRTGIKRTAITAYNVKENCQL